MIKDLSANAQKAMLLMFIGTVGWEHERSTNPEHALQKLCGLTEEEALAAFKECEEHGFMKRPGSPKRGDA